MPCSMLQQKLLSLTPFSIFMVRRDPIWPSERPLIYSLDCSYSTVILLLCMHASVFFIITTLNFLLSPFSILCRHLEPLELGSSLCYLVSYFCTRVHITDKFPFCSWVAITKSNLASLVAALAGMCKVKSTTKIYSGSKMYWSRN